MTKECHICRQPINAGMYTLGMWGQYGYQHKLEARWYMPLDLCPESGFMKIVNLLVAKIKGRAAW
jgi:hypothetical protein